jgi:hypothetical protein
MITQLSGWILRCWPAVRERVNHILTPGSIALRSQPEHGASAVKVGDLGGRFRGLGWGWKVCRLFNLFCDRNHRENQKCKIARKKVAATAGSTTFIRFEIR